MPVDDVIVHGAAVDNQKMRLGLYRKIEIARKQLPAMDEEAFRALLRSEFGVPAART